MTFAAGSEITLKTVAFIDRREVLISEETVMVVRSVVRRSGAEMTVTRVVKKDE